MIRYMKKSFFLLLVLFCINAYSQKDKLPQKLLSFEKDLRGELLEMTPWGQSDKLFSISDSEMKEPAVIINETRGSFIELPRIDDKTTLVYDYRLYYKRVHLVEDKSVEHYNKIYLTVSNAIDLVDLRARTISSKGKVSKEFNEKDMKLTEEDGKKSLILALEGAEKGGEVEWFFITRNNISEYGHINVQGNTFIRDYKYIMRVPEHVEYLFKAYNKCPEVETETKGDYNYYRMKGSKIPVLEKESFQDYDAELMRQEYVLAYIKSKGKVRLNTYADYTKNLYKNIMKDKDKSMKDIKKLSAKLKLEDAGSDMDKIKIIENWIKTNINYTDQIYYTNMKELLSNKFANDLGLLKLYAFLLDYNNIKYQIWVTCDKGDMAFDEDFESFDFLDNHYFYFPKSKKFIDPKNVAWRIGLPPSSIIGQKALQIKTVDLGNDVTSSKYTIGVCKTPSCQSTNAVMKIDLTLDAALSKATIKYYSEESGYDNYIRTLYAIVTDESKRKEILEDYVKRISKDAVVSKVSSKNNTFDDPESASKPAVINATLTTSTILESAGDKTIIKVGTLIGEQSELYSDKPRQSHIVDRYPHMYTRTIKITIPDGYNTKGLEKLKINKVYKVEHDDITDSIGFISDYVIEGNTLTINCVEYYQLISWPMEKYEEYRDVVNAAADFNKLVVILDPKK
jgi:hypothetical protein